MFLRGNGHRPDQSRFLSRSKTGFGGRTLWCVFARQNHAIRFAPPFVSTSDFQSEFGEVFGEIGGELPAKFGRRFSSFFCWGKSSEAFSTETPPQISPSKFTTRFWVVEGPTVAISPHEANASSGAQSESPRRSRKPVHQKHPRRENQDSRHKLNQPRSFAATQDLSGVIRANRKFE